MKYLPHLGIVIMTTFLTACFTTPVSVQQLSSSSGDSTLSVPSSLAQIDISKLYRYYESKELGVSLYVPASFAFPRTTTGGIMEFNDAHIPYDEFIMFDSDTGGEAGYISVTKTNDDRILSVLSQDHPLEDVIVNDIKMQKFTLDAVANPEGFVQKIDGGYLVVEFTFLPDEDAMDTVVASLRMY